MTLSFSDLPPDVHFRILYFLEFTDIVRVRQVSKRLYDLSFERTIWADAYRQSDQFLPPGPLPTHSTRDLQQLILRAHRLEANWNTPAPQIKHKRSIDYTQDIAKLQLFDGRYLVVGMKRQFMLYDLERDTDWDEPVFVYKGYRGERYFYTPSGPCHSTSVENPEMHFPVGVAISHPESIIIWKVDLTSPHAPTMRQVNKMPVNTLEVPMIMTVAYGFLAVCLGDGGDMLYHIGTQRTYFFLADDDASRKMKSRTDRAVFLFTPHSVLIVNQGYKKLVFEHFLLPDTTIAHPCLALIRTHIGVLNEGLTEPALIHFDYREESCRDGTMWLMGLLYSSGPAPITITMHPDDEAMAIDLAPPPNSSDSTFDLAVTTLREKCWAKALARLDRGSGWLMYDLQFDVLSNQRTLKRGFLATPDIVGVNEYAFDGVMGRLCASTDTRIDILDLA